MNIKSILKNSILQLEQAGIPTPELDATILLSFVLNKDKTFLLTHPEYEPKPLEKIRIKKLVKRREKYEPIAYIIGHKEFFGHDFRVDRHTLIPRPETEFLVEAGISYLQSNKSRNLTVLDLGTGSGCIIISLIKALPDSLEPFRFYATDISARALRVARKNAKRLLHSSSLSRSSGVLDSKLHHSNNNITFLQSDLLSNKKLPARFDLILANLPYVPVTGAEKGTEFEPRNAIFADDNGSSIIKKFLTQAKDRINPGGLILIELDPRNATDLQKFAENTYPKEKMMLKKDLAQRDRYLEIQF